METNLEFRKIPSLKFLYEVNCDGTKIRNARSKRCLKCRKQSHHDSGDYWTTLVKIAGKVHRAFIHRVVAECWLGQKPEGYEVDHIDRNSLNNHWTNLRYVTHSEQMLNRNYSWAIPVCLKRDSETLCFETSTQAAKYLAQIYPHKKVQSFKSKFYHRRKRIFDFDVIYLRNAETGHGNQEMGKEQSTMYLVGTTDRWNDSKQAEERERVKHL